MYNDDVVIQALDLLHDLNLRDLAREYAIQCAKGRTKKFAWLKRYLIDSGVTRKQLQEIVDEISQKSTEKVEEDVHPNR